MGKVVAFISMCVAWCALCTPASPAYCMTAGPLADVSPAGWGHPAFDDAYIPNSSHHVISAPAVQTVLLPADSRAAFQAGENGLNNAFYSWVGAGLFTGSARAVEGLVYSIDPHTLCVSVQFDEYGSCVHGEWAATRGPVSGGGARHDGNASPGSQSGFMAIAGLTLIGLSGLRKDRGANTAVRVYNRKEQTQPGGPRSWKDYSSQNEPAYQTRAA